MNEEQRTVLLGDLTAQNVGLLAEINRLRAEVEKAQKERDAARAVAESIRGSLRAFRFPLPFAPPAFPWESDDGW